MIYMECQDLISMKKTACCLLQILLGTLKVKFKKNNNKKHTVLEKKKQKTTKKKKTPKKPTLFYCDNVIKITPVLALTAHREKKTSALIQWQKWENWTLWTGTGQRKETELDFFYE